MKPKSWRVAIVVIVAGAAGAAAAQSGQMPARRAGEWRTVIAMTGMPTGMSTTACVDPASERAFSPFSASPGGRPRGPADCSQREAHPIVGGWAFSSVCKPPSGPPTRTSGTVTGDFRTHLHVVVNTERPNGARHMTMDQTWVGPCTGGTGRTVTLPDGRTMTIPGR